MECLTEFTCSVFVDGELPEPEHRQVEKHLGTCPSCREMVAALREENRLLVHFVQEIDLSEPAHALITAQPARPASRKDVLKFGGLVIGLATFVKLATLSPETLVLPASPVNLDWLDPSNLTGWLNWLVGGIVFVGSEGVSRMASLVNGVSVLALFLLVLTGGVVLVRRTAGRGAMVAMMGAMGAMLLMIASAPASYALDIRNGGQNKVSVVSAGETVDDSLLIAGDTVIIDGTVNGDLIALARRVTVNGTVKGNIITAAQSIDISGTVEGTIISAGQTIQVNGHVTRNVLGFGQSFTIGKDAHVDGDAAGFGNELHENGTLGRSFYAFGLADIAGSVGRNVAFYGGAISVLPMAHIGGDLTSHVQKAEQVHIAPGATIVGKQMVELQKPAQSQYKTLSFYFGQLLRLATAFVSGLILYLLFPQLRRISFSDVGTMLKSGGVGFLAAVATPIAALLLLITFIGAPVALVGFVAWLLGLYLGKIVVANFVGRAILGSDTDRMSSVALSLLVGLALVIIVINLPYVGGLVSFVFVLVGLGALVMNVYDSFQRPLGSGPLGSER